MKRAGVEVEQALIAGPSGWPLSLMKLPSLSALQLPWASALRQRLAEFLSLIPPAGKPRLQPA